MMDKSKPAIPLQVLPTGFMRNLTFDMVTDDLWEDVLAEVCDEEYLTRLHHNVGTYDKGCRGPLCRKALREHPKRRTPTGFSGLNPREERLYDPVLEFFHTVAKFRLKQYQQEVYKELTG